MVFSFLRYADSFSIRLHDIDCRIRIFDLRFTAAFLHLSLILSLFPLLLDVCIFVVFLPLDAGIIFILRFHL
jgi:hypothetical protein